MCGERRCCMYVTAASSAPARTYIVSASGSTDEPRKKYITLNLCKMVVTSATVCRVEFKRKIKPRNDINNQIDVFLCASEIIIIIIGKIMRVKKILLFDNIYLFSKCCV